VFPVLSQKLRNIACSLVELLGKELGKELLRGLESSVILHAKVIR
jgi:hypothetical protein